ncbi:MAG: pilus assembly protein TadG-related protein [Gemmatimonadota bacterium]
MIRNLKRLVSDERGAVLLLVAGSMMALLSVVALAVDFGMLTVARTEAQRVADLSALAGAGGLLQSPGNEPLARALAVDYALRNDIRHNEAIVQPTDVEVDLVNDRVTVTVYRTIERGNPVNTFFARVFGVNGVSIAARATAEASPAGGVNCLLPLALPDRWFEAGGPGNDPDDYNADHGDYYVPWDPAAPSAPYTGYSEADVGVRIMIKANTGPGSMNPSWYFPWAPPDPDSTDPAGVRGAELYSLRISGCIATDKGYVFGPGSVVDTEPGSMTGPTKAGFQRLIAKDPNAAWNTGMNCVTDALYQLSNDPTYCRGSARVRAMPMFNPTEEPDPGRKPFTFTNFVGVFVEEIEGNKIYARFTGYTGVTFGGTGSPSAALFKKLQLID